MSIHGRAKASANQRASNPSRLTLILLSLELTPRPALATGTRVEAEVENVPLDVSPPSLRDEVVFELDAATLDVEGWLTEVVGCAVGVGLGLGLGIGVGGGGSEVAKAGVGYVVPRVTDESHADAAALSVVETERMVVVVI